MIFTVPLKIKVILTHVFYVSFLSMHNMHAQSLTFAKGVFTKTCAILFKRKKSTSGAIIKHFFTSLLTIKYVSESDEIKMN